MIVTCNNVVQLNSCLSAKYSYMLYFDYYCYRYHIIKCSTAISNKKISRVFEVSCFNDSVYTFSSLLKHSWLIQLKIQPWPFLYRLDVLFKSSYWTKSIDTLCFDRLKSWCCYASSLMPIKTKLKTPIISWFFPLQSERYEYYNKYLS